MRSKMLVATLMMIALIVSACGSRPTPVPAPTNPPAPANPAGSTGPATAVSRLRRSRQRPVQTRWREPAGP